MTEPDASADYGFSSTIAVRFAETDAQGVAHNAAYVVWLEVARVDYLARFDGGYQGMRDQGIEAITTESYLRYVAPARFDDRLTIHTSCRDVRGARFKFHYRIERDGDLIAEAWTAHACVDAQTLRPTRVPEGLRAAIARVETPAA